MAPRACGSGSAPHRFAFAVSLGATDESMCDALRTFLGVGRVRTYPRCKKHYDDEVVFVVRRVRDLIEVVAPFLDEHLRPSFKRRQYDVWRTALVLHWETTARRVRGCSHEGCDEPRRARGLCRRHYYATYGR
jgi:hypothetical protein